MNHLSNETFQLIQQLYQPPTKFDKILGKQGNPSILLERIEKSAEPLAIPNLLSFVVTNKKENALAAAKVIHNLMEQLAISHLASLDEHIRQMSFYYPNIWGWNKIQPGDIADLDYLQAYQVSVLGISSFHNNGFIREKALNGLSDIWTGKELPFLLIRLNDWVSNVREAASTAVTSRLQSTYASSFVDCLPLIMRLGKKNRIVQSSVVKSIHQLLQDESSRPALFYGFKSPDRFIRRACYQMAFDVKTISPLEIINLAILDKDNLIRLWSVQEIRALYKDAKVLSLLEAFRADPYMEIRREALRIYIESYPERATEELERALLDSHRSMREEARYWITKANPIDFAAYYRNNLTEGKSIYAAISGLGETGNASDGTLIKPFVTHSLTKIRWVSINALAKLNPRAYVDLFLQVILDPSASVSREAAKALKRSGHLLDPLRLWNEIENANHDHIKANLLFLIAHLPKWESIFYLLKAATSRDEFISKMAYLKINHWRARFNTSFIYPTTLQKKNLLNLIEKNGDNLDIPTREAIKSIVKSL
jgi:HEAT repeat protein